MFGSCLLIITQANTGIQMRRMERKFSPNWSWFQVKSYINIYLFPYPAKALHTYISPFTHIRLPPYKPKPSIPIPGPPYTLILKPPIPISGTPLPTKALHTHLRPSIHTQLHILDPHTFPWRFTPTLVHTQQSHAFLTYPRPSIPFPNVTYPP